MNLSWSNRVIKYVLFVFNLLFVISGIIMIAVGVSVKEYYTDYDVFLSDKYFSLPNLLIAVGSLIFFISFFGCCGAIRESWFMIFIFSILLSIIFILEFSAGIAGYVLRDKTGEYLETELSDTMKKYQFNIASNPSAVTKMWDTIQYEFQCCGASGAEDWTKIPRTPTSTKGSVTSSTSSPSPPSSSSSPPSSSSSPPSSSSSIPTSSSATTTTTASSVESLTSIVTSVRRRREVAEDEPAPENDLPASCCKSKPGTAGVSICRYGTNESAPYYNIGCVEGFGKYLKDHAVTLGGVGLAIAFIQLFGVIFACHLTKQLKHGFYST